MLIDSHCHLDQLDLTTYQGSLDAALTHARDLGVHHFLCVCIDMNNIQATLDIARARADVSASVGVHPSEQHSYDPSLMELIKLASEDKVIAIIKHGGSEWWREAVTGGRREE